MSATSTLTAPREAPRSWFHDRWPRYVFAVAVTVLALAVRGAITPLIGIRFAYEVFLAAILLTAWVAGLGPALLSTALALFFTAVFWVKPLWTPAVSSAADLMGVFFAGAVSVAVVLFVDSARRSKRRMREARRIAELNASRLARLQQLTGDVSAAVDLPSTAEIAARHGRSMLRARASFVAIDDASGSSPTIQHVEGFSEAALRRWSGGDEGLPGSVRWVIVSGRAQVFETMDSNEPSDHDEGTVLAAPLHRAGRTVGALAFELPRRRIGADEIELARSIAAECSLAMERVRLFEAERDARRRAERAVSAHKDLLAVVSHDLRSPLGVVVMAAERVARSGQPDLERAATLIKRASERMTGLIADLLDATSVEAGMFRVRRVDDVSVKRFVHDAVELARPAAAQRHLALEVDLADEDVALGGDRGRLMQVLGNLLGNAIRLTPEGGTITVCSRVRPEEVEIAVADTGPGIPEDELTTVFERYFRGERPKGAGVGLGLYITKGIVEAHGGTIVAESSPGLGATFRFTLPRRAPEA